MAQLTLDDLLTQVQDFIPGKGTAVIRRAANLALRELYMVAGPPKRWTLTTVAPYETGTIALSQADTAVTLTGGTFATASDKQLIRIDGDDAWFTFTRTNGTTGTVGSNWAATSVTVATFTLAYAFADIPTDVLSVENIWRNNKDPLHRASDEEYARWLLGSQDPGEPRAYALVKGTTSASSAIRVQLLPFPDAAYVYTAVGKTRATQFTGSGTEYTGLPEELDDVLLAGTMMYCWDQQDKQDRAAWWRAIWEAGLRKAAAHNTRGHMSQFGEPELGYYDDGVANRLPVQ